MPTFKYLALDAAGAETTGTIEATNERLASTRLREQGLRPVEFSEVGEGIGGMAISIPGMGPKKVKPADRTIFTRQLSTLLDAGLPLLRALNILVEQSKGQRLGEILNDVKDRVQAGASFSEALAAHGDVFDKLYVSMVKAGEVGGVLEVVLDRLADFGEKAEALKAKVKSAAMYPSIMLAVAVIVVIILMVYVIPQFSKMFGDMGVALPLPTRLLIAFSNFLVSGGVFLVLGSPVLLFFAWKAARRFPQGEEMTDRWKLNAPLFGPLTQKTVTARFTRTLGTLVQSGVPILQALQIVKDTAGNVIVAKAIESVAASIQEGEGIAAPLHKTGIFPAMVTNMIAVGEETGALDNMLMKIADNYELQVDEAVKGLTSLMEPALIVCMGGVVGWIVASLFLPMFNITQAVKH